MILHEVDDRRFNESGLDPLRDDPHVSEANLVTGPSQSSESSEEQPADRGDSSVFDRGTEGITPGVERHPPPHSPASLREPFGRELADLIFTDVPGRVAKQLLQLAQRFGTQEGGALRVTHDLTQEEIAHLVGASRETVNKALADFAQRGWIRLEGKSVLISDSERLVRRAR